MAKKKMTKEQANLYGQAQLASFWNFKFKDAMVQKSEYTKKWQTYWDAYHGDYFVNKGKPSYKSDLVSNYIFSIVETIRPIMVDNDPKFQSMPRQPEGLQFANDLQEAFSYEWDREDMTPTLHRELITTLVVGTTPYFVPWDSKEKQIKAIPVNPYNLFPDPLATSVEDAEYLIYASYRNAERLRRLFPKHAELLHGGDINYGELVHDNNKDARVDNQVLVLEVWTRDYETMEKDEKENLHQKYPNGRVITVCPELGLVLNDKANPYKDGKFPFVLHKDYDIPGKFWGEGEVSQLLSPQKYMNELNNAVLDNAKATANLPWVVDRNAGIPHGSITSRPGLVIRKNPGSEVNRPEAPNMPAYVMNTIEAYKSDMEQISGIFDSLKGNSETGVYTAQGVLALQEAGQARIRLKVKLMENFLGKLGTMWYERMRQFWTDERYIRIVKADGSYEVKEVMKDAFDYDYDIRIMAGSTMPVNRGAMLDFMIRLAQTQMPDGQTLVDREAVVEYLPSEVKSALLQRSKDKQLVIEQQMQELSEMSQQLSQQLQQITEQSQSNDDDTFGVIEELTSAIEKINKQILQLEQSHATMEEDKRKQEEQTKLKESAYNSGYSDAENLLSSETMEEENPLGNSPMEDLGEGETGGALPEDILQGLEELSDDELALLMEQNPQLTDLLR